MLDFKIEYWFVDTIPFGAHVARRDEDGRVCFYMSRQATEAELTTGLAAVSLSATSDYVCEERHAAAS